MKHFKKILLIPLFLITACLIMTGCAKTAVQEETENKAAIEAADVASIQDFTDQQFAQQLVKANYEDFQSRVDSGEVVISRIFDNDLAQRWKTFTEKHGAIQKAEVAETNKTDDGYNCKLILTGEDGKMMALTITYDKGGYPLSTIIEDYTDDATKTVGSKMGEAGINIVVGLGVVFLILTFLTFFIYAVQISECRRKERRRRHLHRSLSGHLSRQQLLHLQLRLLRKFRLPETEN
ncbi:MAG: hypothetical protein LKM41_00400 [Lachnospiraceae bacterium]|nr:hypothetical protein [Lachnospiraceae bacterium]